MEHIRNKKARKSLIYTLLEVFGKPACGGGEIRTPGTFQYDGFQDRSIKPLWHSSVAVFEFSGAKV